MGHHPAHKLPFGLRIQVSFMGRNPLHRCLLLLASYERFAGRIRQEFSVPLYRRAAASMMHLTILTKTSKLLTNPRNSRNLYGKRHTSCNPRLLTSFVQSQQQHCLGVPTVLSKTPFKLQNRSDKERKGGTGPDFKIGYKERSSSHSYSLAPTETLDSTGFSD